MPNAMLDALHAVQGALPPPHAHPMHAHPMHGPPRRRRRGARRDTAQGITKAAIRKLARKGGVKRLSGTAYEETRGVLKVFLETMIRDAVVYTEHARRKTVTPMDVCYALRRHGRRLYGYDQ